MYNMLLNLYQFSLVLNISYKPHVTIYDNIINKELKGQPQAYTLCYNNNKISLIGFLR